jgi:predicted GNAT family acetyltransferase
MVMELVKDEPEFNLYIIGDIENYGYDKPYLDYFGEFDENGTIKAVMVRFYSIFTAYSKGDFDVNGFAEIINSFNKFGMLTGQKEVVSKFESSVLKLSRPDVLFFAVLNKIDPSFKVNENIMVKRACLDDIERIVELKNSIKEFSDGSGNFKEILLNEFKTGTSHGYYVELEGKMISYAQTSAENSMSCMVVSVMTDEKYRGQGFASACIKTLCMDMTNQGKTLCLYYKNPKAGDIYKRIGFKDIGIYNMYR